MLPTYSFAAMNWTGGFGLRYTSDTTKPVDDGAGNEEDVKRTATEVTASLGVGKEGEKVSWGVELNTQGDGGNIKTSWTPTGLSDVEVAVSAAWFRYSTGMMDSMDGTASLTVGRQSPIFRTGKGQLFLDKNITLDGLGLSFSFGNFAVDVSHYFLTGFSDSVGDEDVLKRQYLFSLQGKLNFRLGNDAMLHAAAGYHRLSNNLDPDDIPIFSIGANAGKDPHFLQGLAKFKLPNMLYAEFEYIKNGSLEDDAEADEDNDNDEDVAYSAAVSYGKIEKAHDFVIGAMYQKKGAKSVIEDFTYNKWSVGRKGFGVGIKYALAKGLHLKGKYFSLEEITEEDDKEENDYLEIGAVVRF